MKKHLLSVLFVAGLCYGAAKGSQNSIPATFFDLDRGCSFKSEYKDELIKQIEIYERLSSYIAPPKPQQDRDKWLKTLKEYRDAVRNGRLNKDAHIDMNFTGERAWVRLGVELSRILDLRPFEKLKTIIEAKWISGNNELCITCEKINSSNSRPGRRVIAATALIPKDGDWHIVEAEVAADDFDVNNSWLRPIIGMDSIRDKTPGHIEIRGIDFKIDDPVRMAKIKEYVRSLKDEGLDRSLYDEPSQQWIQGAFACHFTFMYDKSFYDVQTGEYKLESFFADGEEQFGGYDILLLWHAYPRIGADERNQMDFYRDMPGGVEAISKLVKDCNKRGVKVFINYNPWDTGTNREGGTDADFLVDFVAQTQVDGIFLDTMSGSDTIRKKLDEVKPGIILAPEGGPPIKNLATLNGSWAQWNIEKREYVPSLDHRKWIEPRHMRWQIWRWMPNHRQEIRRAFFNGSGMIIWENIFGAYNPWPKEDRRMWRRAVRILRYFRDNFTSDEWEPYYPNALTNQQDISKIRFDREVPGLFIHRWPGDGCKVFTLFLKDRKPLEQTSGRIWYRNMTWLLFEVAYNPDVVYYDLWNGNQIIPERIGDKVRINGFIDRFAGIGCIAEIAKEKIDKNFLSFLEVQQKAAARAAVFCDERNFAKSVIEPEPVIRTRKIPRDKIPQGMVFVGGGKKHIHLEHMRRECGCYPDPGTPVDQWEKFLWGDMGHENMTHDFDADIKSFLIDEAEVTNAQFREFLEKSGYKPKFSKNFLKHWPDGKMPEHLADHPVVYVDIDDARAYAKWAGKRLPTEYEWQLAAQGMDDRKWPWGNEFDANRCNMTGDRTMPVRSLPDGKSPCGCYHMSGNVYEWTESMRDDGHTRFVIIRGGSYFKAEGSKWYFPGGPRACDDHEKFILMWPGLDRCATIGFRCVMDTK